MVQEALEGINELRGQQRSLDKTGEMQANTIWFFEKNQVIRGRGSIEAQTRLGRREIKSL